MKGANGLRMLALLLFYVTGCQYIGGGIAGASYDPIWQVKAAQRYPTTVATNRIEMTVARRIGEQPPQFSGGIMHAFPVRQESVHEIFEPIARTGFEARYRKHRLEILSGTVLVISEALPKVFNTRPVGVGLGSVGSQPVIMVVSRSRASTGLYFIGLYTDKGAVLYKDVLGAGQVWDIRLAGDRLEIVGHSEIRTLAIKEKSE